MQKLYVSRITADHWMAKNDLEKAAKKLAKEMERRLIPGDKLSAYKKEFRDKIEKLNKEFKRCKPLEFYFHTDYSPRIDHLAHCQGVFMIEIFQIKNYVE